MNYIFQIKTLRLRELSNLLGPSAGKYRSRDFNTGLPDPKAYGFSSRANHYLLKFTFHFPK